MDVIVCLDDKNGMLFNGRRQSRDRAVVEDIVNNLCGRRLKLLQFSSALFEEYSSYVEICGDFTCGLAEDDVIFCENVDFKDFPNIREITVYRWNRVYPSDFICGCDFSALTLCSKTELAGNSHGKITKEIYRR